jgi:hypothetical protein
VDTPPRVDTDCTRVEAEAEGLVRRVAEGAGSVAAERLVELDAAVVVANVNQPDLHSHNLHTKRSAQAWGVQEQAEEPIVERTERDLVVVAAVVVVVEQQQQPSKRNNQVERVEEEEDLEEEEVVGECNSAEVQTGFCSSRYCVDFKKEEFLRKRIERKTTRSWNHMDLSKTR